jgi:hypothetical protein
MRKEDIQKRLEEIDKAIEKENAIINQHIANVNMLNGGKQEALYWLNKLNHPEDAMNIEQFKELTGAESVELVNAIGD